MGLWSVIAKDKSGNIFHLKYSVGSYKGQRYKYIRPAPYRNPKGASKAEKLDELMLKNGYIKQNFKGGVRYRKERENADYQRHKYPKIF